MNKAYFRSAGSLIGFRSWIPNPSNFELVLRALRCSTLGKYFGSLILCGIQSRRCILNSKRWRKQRSHVPVCFPRMCGTIWPILINSRGFFKVVWPGQWKLYHVILMACCLCFIFFYVPLPFRTWVIRGPCNFLSLVALSIFSPYANAVAP